MASAEVRSVKSTLHGVALRDSQSFHLMKTIEPFAGRDHRRLGALELQASLRQNYLLPNFAA